LTSREPSGNVAPSELDERIAGVLGSISARETAVLCGAGISFHSGLPVVHQLVPYVLEVLGATRREISTVMDSDLPFEAFIETLQEHSSVDDLFDLFDQGEPNTNHVLLAKLLKAGYLKTIVTTNFDRLLERALAGEGLLEGADFDVFHREMDFSGLDWSSSRTKVIKIHGSVADKKGMSITLKQVASREMAEPRRRIITNLFATGGHQNVLILGYSCSDIFDISPCIETIEGSRKRVFCVEHSAENRAEDIRSRGLKNPFGRFQDSHRLFTSTDVLVKTLWDSLVEDEDYRFRAGQTPWRAYVDRWDRRHARSRIRRWFTACVIKASLFQRIGEFRTVRKYLKRALWWWRFMTIYVWEAGMEQRLWEQLAQANAVLGDAGNAERDFARADSFSSGQTLDRLDKMLGVKASFLEGEPDYRTAILRGSISHALSNPNPYWPPILRSMIELGDRHRALAEAEDARGEYEFALQVARDKGFAAEEMTLLVRLADLDLEQGRLAEAVQGWQKAIPLTQSVGDKRTEALCLTQLGHAHSGLREYAAALGFHQAAVPMFREIGSKQGEALARLGEGVAHMGLGQASQAVVSLETALRIARKIGARNTETHVLLNLDLAKKELSRGE